MDHAFEKTCRRLKDEAVKTEFDWSGPCTNIVKFFVKFFVDLAAEELADEDKALELLQSLGMVCLCERRKVPPFWRQEYESDHTPSMTLWACCSPVLLYTPLSALLCQNCLHY